MIQNYLLCNGCKIYDAIDFKTCVFFVFIINFLLQIWIFLKLLERHNTYQQSPTDELMNYCVGFPNWKIQPWIIKLYLRNAAFCVWDVLKQQKTHATAQLSGSVITAVGMFESNIKLFKRSASNLIILKFTVQNISC